jgi:quinol monooxygenase YgiN
MGPEPSQQRPQAAPIEEKTMSKGALFIRHQAQPGKRDEIKRVWEKYAQNYVADSRGQLAYFYCYDDNDPDAIVVFQLHADVDSTKEFVNQRWYADYERETEALLAGPSEFRMATPQWTKGASA